MTPEQMELRIQQAYPDCQVAVLDMTGTQNHFEVRIASETLKSLKRIEQHKSIMSLFSEELKTGEVHALSIKPFSI